MILKASQRGGGKQLARHLLKTQDNEHVEVHEIRGFVSDDLVGAFQEAYCDDQGGRFSNVVDCTFMNSCKNYGGDVLRTTSPKHRCTRSKI